MNLNWICGVSLGPFYFGQPLEEVRKIISVSLLKDLHVDGLGQELYVTQDEGLQFSVSDSSSEVESIFSKVSFIANGAEFIGSTVNNVERILGCSASETDIISDIDDVTVIKIVDFDDLGIQIVAYDDIVDSVTCYDPE